MENNGTNRRPGLGVCAGSMMVAGCLFFSSAMATMQQPPPLPLLELEGMATGRVSAQALLNQENLGLRLESIRETAEVLGVQKAIQYRYDQINAVLENKSSELDRVFDFRPLLSHDDKLLPPVITEANDVFNLKDDNWAESSQTTFEIKAEARIVSTAPTWRNYLIHRFTVNEIANPALLPKTPEDKAVWLDGVRRGWDMGSKQAEQLFQANLARLVRDFRGIIRFHVLEAQGVVSMPILAEGDRGIRVNGRMLDIGQRVFRITDPVHFRQENDWNPLQDPRKPVSDDSR